MSYGMEYILQCFGCEVYNVNIERGEGCRLYDDNGKEYVDFEAGVWSTALGHNHTRVNDVIKKQIDKIIHLGYRYRSTVVEDAAFEVLQTLELPDGKCIFLSSGSEAVELGVQIIKRITGKPLLLTLSNTFLSSYGSSGRKSSDEWFILDWSKCSNCPISDKCDPNCSLFKSIPFELLGGFVFEPGNAGGMVKLPPKGLIAVLGSLVKEKGGFLMANEVTTGFGRTGKWFGYQHYDYHPHIISMGKSIGNGYPVSALALSKNIAESLESEGFRYVQSHQNDALGCAVAAEVIKVIREEKLIDRSKILGDNFKDKLDVLCHQHDCIKEVRGRGLMLVIEFKEDYRNGYLIELHRKLFEEGFIIGCNPAVGLLRFYPSLVIKEADIDRMIEKLHEILP